MKKIKNIQAREILDSRGNPTVEVELNLEGNFLGKASVPSGASTGKYEAVELRDSEKRYNGKGVLKAVSNINTELKNNLLEKKFDQKSLDEKMINLDGTKNKSRLGANAILGISLAFSHAFAKSENQALYQYFREISETKDEYIMPSPMMNILNGGKHAENSTDIQEFMIMPLSAPNFKEALRFGAEIFHSLKKILKERRLNTSVGDEGGFAPTLSSNKKAIEIILTAIKSANYKAGKDIFIALDSAASEFYNNNEKLYELKTENKKLSSKEMINFYEKLIQEFPLISIEDGLAEDDWIGFKFMTEKLGTKVQIVGDDLFVTNEERLNKGILEKSANSILIKLNQIGTISETINATKKAKNAGFTAIISHRSGETEDTTIADFAVGLATGQIKTGSLSRGERVAKYNRLLKIEEELGEKAVFLGMNSLKI